MVEIEYKLEFKKILASGEANTFSSIDDSKKFMDKLRKRAKLEKNESV